MKNKERIDRKATRIAATESGLRKAWGQSLHVESLEARQMMAGDVSVSINGNGDLFVIGDGADNNVDISTDLITGDLIIAGNEGTNIVFDGESANTQVISLETDFTLGRNLTINMRGGDDEVRVDHLDVVSDVTAVLGSGDDTLDLSGFTSAVWISLGYSGTELWTKDTGEAITVTGPWREMATVTGIDHITGTGYDDWISGDAGGNLLDGGGGSDHFVFYDGHGADRINGFDALDNGEVIDLSAVTAITSFADLVNNHMTQQGSDVVIVALEALVRTNVALEHLLFAN